MRVSEREFVTKVSTELRLMCDDVLSLGTHYKKGEINATTYLQAKDRYIEEMMDFILDLVKGADEYDR